MTVLPQHNIALLKIYLFYRTSLALLLASMFFTSFANNVLGTFSQDLFLWSSCAYVCLCIFTLFISPPQKLVKYKNRLAYSLVADVIAMLLMIHASGGIESGLGYLLLVDIAFAGIFVRGQLAIAFAAMTSLLVIGETLYLSQIVDFDSKSIFSAGSLGILIFCAAYAFQFLTEKIRASNLEAAAQAEFAEHLQRLAQAIVVRMRTGIIVVDNNSKIELINDSALQLLNLPSDKDYSNVQLGDISSLQSIIEEWRSNRSGGPSKVKEIRAGQQARISLSSLNLGASSRTVIYLEDHRVLAQQAQQLKLASLGRLTGSIAHEIRNPLGAISHAAQLLAESPSISNADKRLTEIIHQHSNRVNHIVESTLALSSRKEPQAETLDLNKWLPHFIGQFSTGLRADIGIEISKATHKVKIDPTHLSQVLTNLVDNGLRYSKQHTGEDKILLRVNQTDNDDTSFIEVIDFGVGIDKDKVTHIFDPFYTTEQSGSGLGLYISKELCEINQANLHYIRTPNGHSCFRIDFSHYQRMF